MRLILATGVSTFSVEGDNENHKNSGMGFYSMTYNLCIINEVNFFLAKRIKLLMIRSFIREILK